MKVASSKYFIAQQANLGRVNGYVEEIITGQKVVKVFCHEQDALEEFDQLNGELQEAATTAQSYSGLVVDARHDEHLAPSTTRSSPPSAASSRSSASSASAGAGRFPPAHPPVQPPDQSRGVQPVQCLVIAASAGAERIYEVIREPVEEPDPAHAADLVRDGHAFYWQRLPRRRRPRRARPRARGDVRFEDVTFGDAPEKTVLRHISLYAKPWPEASPSSAPPARARQPSPTCSPASTTSRRAAST